MGGKTPFILTTKEKKMIKDEEIVDEVIEAKRKGFKFIKVILDRSRIGRNQSEIHIAGAVILKGFKKGMGTGGLPEYNFEPRGGESMIFQFSREEREYVCWLYDDDGPGYFSRIGFNRDLLASHLEEKCFILSDPDVEKDVIARYEFIKSNPGKKRKQIKENIVVKDSDSVEDIDAQIAFLKKKREDFKREDSISVIDSQKDPMSGLSHDEKVEINKQKYLDEQRRKRNKRQRAYRQNKKDKTQTGKGTPELTNA